MRKQITRRIATVMLSLITLLSLSVPVIAENEDAFLYGQITEKWIDNSAFEDNLQVNIVSADGSEIIYECDRQTHVNGKRYLEIDALNEIIPVGAYVKFIATDGETIDVLRFDNTPLSFNNITYDTSTHTFNIQDMDVSNLPIYYSDYDGYDYYFYTPYLDENHSYSINVYDYAIEIVDYNALNGLNTIKYIDTYSYICSDFSQAIGIDYYADDTGAEIHIQLYDSNSNLIYDEATETIGYYEFVDLNNADSEYCIKLWQENNGIASTPVYSISYNTTHIPILYGQITEKWIGNSAFEENLQVNIVSADGSEIIYECDRRTRVNGKLYQEIDALNEIIPVGAYVKFTATDGEIDVIKIAEKNSLATTITGISCVDMSNNICQYTIAVESNGVPSGEFIVAIYDIYSSLIGLKAETKTIIFEETITDTVAVNGTPHTYKAFFWNSLDNLMPLCNNTAGSVSK